MTEVKSEEVHRVVQSVHPETASLGRQAQEGEVDRHLCHGAAQGDGGQVLSVVNTLQYSTGNLQFSTTAE